jgi:hypothetical protein
MSQLIEAIAHEVSKKNPTLGLKAGQRAGQSAIL